MQRSSRSLAALLVIVVMHGAVSASPLMPAPVQDTAGHAQHGHDGMKGDDSDGTSHDSDSGNCCDSGSCDCGCATTSPAAAFRPTPVARDWARIASVHTDDFTADLSGFAGAPFRPPA